MDEHVGEKAPGLVAPLGVKGQGTEQRRPRGHRCLHAVLLQPDGVANEHSELGTAPQNGY